MFGQGFNYGFISGGPPCFTDTTDIFKDNSGVALYTLDYDASTAIDATTDYSGTPTGVDFGIGGKSLYGARFIGNTSYITLPFMSEIPTNSLPDKSYSVSFWVNSNATRLNSTSGTYRSGQIFGFYDDTYSMIGFGGNTNSNFPTGKLFYYNYGGPGQRNNWIITPNSYADNSWHHVVVTDEYVSSGNTRNRKLYVDGSLIVSDSQANTWNASSSVNTIGSDTANNQLDADVDQVRIFNKAISSAEVGTLYGNGLGEIACNYISTTDNNAYPITNAAYYKLDNSSEDFAGTNDGTDSSIEYRFGRFGQAAVFNGSSSFIQTTLALSSTNVTTSLWFKSDVSTSTNQPLFFTSNGGRIDINIAEGTASANGYYNVLQIVAPNATTQWNHLAVVFEGFAGSYSGTYGSAITFTAYINGSAVTSSGSLTPYAQTANGYEGNMRIGRSGGGYYFNGDIDQVRIFGSALSASNVTQLYNEKPETDTSNFKTVLYEGTGANQYISNVGMDLETGGGLVWIKNRDTSDSHALLDNLRGISESGSNYIASDRTDAEASSTNMPSSLEKSGFFVQGGGGRTNTNNESYTAWVWKAGGTPVTIGVNSITGSTPSIASTVSANPAAGFSIIRNTGTANYSDTIGHGLTQAPEIVIQKPVVSNVAWYVLFNVDGTGGWDYASLNTTAAFAPDSPVRFSANSTTINNWGWTGYDMINYCFHSVAGYSKIGSYTGTGAAGKSVTTGFEPSWLMVKRTNGTSDWNIWDARRGSQSIVWANGSNAEATNSVYEIEFVSTGFVINATASFANGSGDSYIYMAFK